MQVLSARILLQVVFVFLGCLCSFSVRLSVLYLKFLFFLLSVCLKLGSKRIKKEGKDEKG